MRYSSKDKKRKLVDNPEEINKKDFFTLLTRNDILEVEG